MYHRPVETHASYWTCIAETHAPLLDVNRGDARRASLQEDVTVCKGSCLFKGIWECSLKLRVRQESYGSDKSHNEGMNQ
ncbi:MAG: hypothetical protein LUF85_09270 [Bacteroides sp.]|nr:hypothetical protein [Bacteroides sp.]